MAFGRPKGFFFVFRCFLKTFLDNVSVDLERIPPILCTPKPVHARFSLLLPQPRWNWKLVLLLALLGLTRSLSQHLLDCTCAVTKCLHPRHQLVLCLLIQAEAAHQQKIRPTSWVIQRPGWAKQSLACKRWSMTSWDIVRSHASRCSSSQRYPSDHDKKMQVQVSFVSGICVSKESCAHTCAWWICVLCCVVLCCDVLRCVVLCCAVLRWAVRCFAAQCLVCDVCVMRKLWTLK